MSAMIPLTRSVGETLFGAAVVCALVAGALLLGRPFGLDLLLQVGVAYLAIVTVRSLVARTRRRRTTERQQDSDPI
jgi:membrane protein implicated in regulation of membrane protease activity